MKMYLFFILTFSFTTTLSATAQDVENKTHINNYEEVIETGLSKDNMWVNLKKWVSSQFNNYKYVVDMEDKDAGVLIIKWKSPFVSSASSVLEMTAEATYQIDVKENKYRIRIANTNVKVDPVALRRSDMAVMSTESLEAALEDLKFAVDISEAHFNSSTSWMIDSRYEDIINEHKSTLEKVPLYLDDKKKKINKEWVKTNRELEILQNVIGGYSTVNMIIYKSLKESMSTNDDF